MVTNSWSFIQNVNPIQDELFQGCSRMEGKRRQKAPPPPHLHKICHTYAKMMKLGTVIPYLRKIQKNIKTTWLTLIILLTSAFIHWKLSNLDISRSTDTDFISFWCIIYNSFRLFWVYKGCPSKYCYNFDNVNKSGYASSS